MPLTRLLPLLLAPAILSACAGGQKVTTAVSGPPQTNTTTSVKALASAREHRAGLKAIDLLGQIPLPEGARPTHLRPSLRRTSTLGVSVVTELAYRHRGWLIHERFPVVLAFFKTHPVPGFGNGSSGQDGAGASLSFDPIDAVSFQREYGVDLRPAGRLGWTVVKTEASEAWVYPRSLQSLVPAGVQEIDIRGGGVSEHVRDSAKIAQITRWFNALAPAPDVFVRCGLYRPTWIAFVFRDSGGHALATARVPSGGGASVCDPIAFAIHGKQQKSLADGRFGKHSFANRVQRLLGVCFRDFSRQCR